MCFGNVKQKNIKNSVYDVSTFIIMRYNSHKMAFFVSVSANSRSKYHHFFCISVSRHCYRMKDDNFSATIQHRQRGSLQRMPAATSMKTSGG